ncbi:hypothetical protein SASPL_124698 [Salvia splendens]|uniref:adenylate kinase n=1 Tax=Salvia splendens TaxID=180675 RepID=A0A8X8XHF1_SALSN|nr:hypothetical protein SASPL_124698 [Salvia splendens]
MSKQLKEIVNQGKLVSDEIIINLLSKRLESGESKGESGFILDDFPRTVRQAEILNDVTDIDLVVNLKLPEQVLIDKCIGRRICSECGKNFNVATIDVKGENGNPDIYMDPLRLPSHCASKLVTRSDDTETVVKQRLAVYTEKNCEFHSTSSFTQLISIWANAEPASGGLLPSPRKLVEFVIPGGIPESLPKLLEALNLNENEEKQSAAV